MLLQLEEEASHVVRAGQLLLKFPSNKLAASHLKKVHDEWSQHADALAFSVQDSLDPVAFIKALGKTQTLQYFVWESRIV